MNNNTYGEFCKKEKFVHGSDPPVVHKFTFQNSESLQSFTPLDALQGQNISLGLWSLNMLAFISEILKGSSMCKIFPKVTVCVYNEVPQA